MVSGSSKPDPPAWPPHPRAGSTPGDLVHQLPALHFDLDGVDRPDLTSSTSSCTTSKFSRTPARSAPPAVQLHGDRCIHALARPTDSSIDFSDSTVAWVLHQVPKLSAADQVGQAALATGCRPARRSAGRQPVSRCCRPLGAGKKPPS
jgi:hypothetical protein